MIELGLSPVRAAILPFAPATAGGPLGGAAAVSAQTAGSLQLSLPLAGPAAAVAAGMGDLLRRTPLAGAAAALASASGAFVVPNGIAGLSAAVAAAGGAVVLRYAVAGSAAAAALGSGAVLYRAGLAGASTASALATGPVLYRAALSGTSAAAATGTGAVTLNQVPLAQAVTLDYTVPPGDTVAPLLTGGTPIDNSTGVPPSSQVVLSFSEAVVAGSGLITLRNVTDAATIATFNVATAQGSGPGTVSFAGTSVTIEAPAVLPGGKMISVQVAATAIRDLAGNAFAGIADDTTLNFTTAVIGITDMAGGIITDMAGNSITDMAA